MKLMQTLTALICVLALTGCAASIKGSVTAKAPAALTKACNDPVRIDGKKNLERQWRKDRRSLVVCKKRHGNLVKFHRDTTRILNGR